MNIRIIVDEVRHPFCEASPDFCNWEHEYLMYNGLKALAPYAHTKVHAKYWNRWKDNDVRRSVKIMLDGLRVLEQETDSHFWIECKDVDIGELLRLASRRMG